MGKEVLKVQMLGRFSLTYGDTPVLLNKIGSAKSVRLLQMILLAGTMGIAKQELIDSLYAWGENHEGGNRNRNLNNLIYRLKGQLTAAGLPEDEYVVIQDGMCRWQSRFAVELDAENFRRRVYEARALQGAERTQRYLEANECYYGQLLPANQSEMWFYEKSVLFRDLYIETIRQPEQVLRKQKDYKKLLVLYSRAAEIYPFEGWQTEMIRCNLEMYRYEEALSIYKRTMDLYARELGIPPTEEMQKCFEEIEQQRRGGGSRTGQKLEQEKMAQKRDIAGAIFEGGRPDGAYYCTYPSFVDYCRLIVRTSERHDQRAILMFVNLRLTDRRSSAGEAGLNRQMGLLKQAISTSIRSGDAFTRYGNNSYMIVLTQIEKGDCSGVFGRIDSDYNRMPQSGGTLWYHSATIDELETLALNIEETEATAGQQEAAAGRLKEL